MMAKHEKGFLADFRLFFLRGLGILLPSIVTLGILFWAFGLLRDRVAAPMNSAVRQTVIFVAPQVLPDTSLPDWFLVPDAKVAELRDQRQREGLARITDEAIRKTLRSENLAEYWRERWYLEAIGFVVAMVIVYLAGVLLGGIIGRKIYAALEDFFVRLPVIKQVYPNVKQITEFLIGDRGGKGGPVGGGSGKSKVVAVEYPRKGIWTIGLLTGESLSALEAAAGGVPCVTVFIPSSPTPFTGYTITVAKSDVQELSLTMDEVIRFTVSGGVLIPERERGHGSRAIDGGASEGVEID